MYVCIFIYIYTHTHTHRKAFRMVNILNISLISFFSFFFTSLKSGGKKKMSSSLFLLYVCSRKYLMSIVFLKYTLLKKLEMVSESRH